MYLLLRLCGLIILIPALVHAAVLGIPGNGAKLSGYRGHLGLEV